MRVRSAALLTSLLLALGAAPARADVVITVDKDAQRMSVVVDGTPRYSWPVSTGAAGYDTPSGSFRPFRMERTHFSKEFDDAPMPYATFFTNQGHAIHGTNHVRSLGRAVSHGCVRLSVRNAATLFTLVKAQGMNRTQVRIEGEGAAMAEGGPAPAPSRAAGATDTASNRSTTTRPAPAPSTTPCPTGAPSPSTRAGSTAAATAPPASTTATENSTPAGMRGR